MGDVSSSFQLKGGENSVLGIVSTNFTYAAGKDLLSGGFPRGFSGGIARTRTLEDFRSSPFALGINNQAVTELGRCSTGYARVGSICHSFSHSDFINSVNYLDCSSPLLSIHKIRAASKLFHLESICMVSSISETKISPL